MSFQRGAFQQDGFQSGYLNSRDAFPADAFQGDAFQVGAYVATGPVAPSITDQPDNTTIVLGDSATLIVAASGDAPLTYQWYQGNSGDTGTPLVGETSSVLIIASLVTTNYWVRVSNGAGDADSSTATVTVVEASARSNEAGRPSKDKKRRRQRFAVAIDGEEFLVSSPEEAVAILETAKTALEEAIAEPVKVQKQGKLPVKKPDIRIEGMKGPELTEIVSAIRDLRSEMTRMWQEAARTAEIAYLMQMELQRDEEEAILLLL